MSEEIYPPTNWLPLDFTLPLFTPEESKELLACAYVKEFKKARRLDPNGRPYVDLAFRSNEELPFVPGDELYERVADRVLAHLDVINARYGFELHPERERMIPKVAVNRYRAECEGRIGAHTDLGYYQGTDDRKISLTILLDDDFDGGTLSLFDGTVHRPLEGAKAGTAAIFPSFAVHEVEPVTRGVRHSAVVWLRGPRLR